MARGGADSTREAPERRCLVTGETGPKAGLVRFVVGPDDRIVPDVTGKLPGRGMYVTASRPILEDARRSHFSRGAKAPVTVPEDLVAEVERLLAHRVVELVSLARKAGVAIAGFEKVKDALALAGEGLGRGAWRRVGVLLQASDGSERGKAKLWTPEGARWFGCLSAAEIGSAFGRDAVIHAAVASGALGTRVVEEAAKRRGLREVDGGDRAAP